MGYKDICLICRKAYNRGTNMETPAKLKCPECGENTVAVNQKFKPPKKLDLKKWEVVKFIIDNGFSYDKLFEEIEGDGFIQIGKYPENMRDAKEFVKKFDTNGVKKTLSR
jgi:ribosomal protein L33